MNYPILNFERLSSRTQAFLKHITPLSLGEGLGVRLLFYSHHLMRLQRQLPSWMLLDIVNTLAHDVAVLLAVAGVAGLEIIIIGLYAVVIGGVLPIEDDLYFLALSHKGRDFRRDGQPVDSLWRFVCAIALHGDAITQLMKLLDKRRVCLEGGFTTCENTP